MTVLLPVTEGLAIRRFGIVLPRYLGTWHEIARLDHSFQRGMSQVTADYSLNKDGLVKVTNRGYLDSKSEWKQATGKAKFVGKEDVGHLKVSFFGPFYGSYMICDFARHAYCNGTCVFLPAGG